MAYKVEITLPEATVIRTVDGKPSKIEWSKVPAAVIASIAEGGATVILNNAYNGGGKDADEQTKLEQMMKRLRAWYAGDYAVSNRGDSWMGRLKEQYVDDMKAQTGASQRQVEEAIRQAVVDAFGEKEKASFGRFLDALSLSIAKEQDSDVDDVRRELEESLAKRVEEADAERKAKVAKLDVKGLALASFVKAK